MIDRVDQLALSQNDEHFPERYGYKYVASRQDDGWAEGITVETLMSPLDDGIIVDGSLYYDDGEAKSDESNEGEPDQAAQENNGEDIEVALADAKTTPKKSDGAKSAARQTEDGPRTEKSSPDRDAADEKALGSGSPIDLNPTNYSADDISGVEVDFNGFSSQTSLLNSDGFAGNLGNSSTPFAVQEISQDPGSPQSVETVQSTANSQSTDTQQTAEVGNVAASVEDTSTIVINNDITAAALNQLIANADTGSTIVLQDGIYTFDECILINRSDITLKGESESGTIIQFDFPDGQITDGIKITGGEKTRLGVADSEIAEGGSSLIFENNSLVAGDTIYLFQPNTREWLDENGWQNVSMDDADHRPFREVILEVDYVEGDTVYFTHSIPYAMDNGEARIYQIDLLDNISLSDFTVTYNLGNPDALDFSNTLPEYSGTSAVSIVGTNEASIERISITDFASKGLVIGSSIDLEADDIFVSGSHNKGGGGNGYGVLLYESNNSSLTNFEIFDTRHGFTTSSWSAETDNNIHILNTNRDTGFLGSPDRGNVVTIDNAILDFDTPFDSNGGVRWTIVSEGGSNHAVIDPFAENDFNFGHAEGSNRSEKITAGDQGSYLNGKYGYDTLVGGAGEDYLVGGKLSDQLTGGEGSDTFLLRVGDGLDTITDFEFGEAGDTLLISNQPFVDDFSDLYIYADGNDAKVVYGRNSTVILQDVDVADINAANFSFDPTGDITAANYFGSDFETA